MARSQWTKSRILEELRRLHKAGEDLAYTHLSETMQPLVSAAAYHFGSYRRAVEKANIDYAQITRRPRWNKPTIIQMIKEAHRKGEDLHWSAVTRRGDELGRAAFASLQKRLFGSWDRALQAAGLDAAEISRYHKWDRDGIVVELKGLAREGTAINSGALQRDNPGLHAAAIRHFGTYDAALKAAGLDPADIRQRRRWSEDEVVKQLKAFSRKHRSVSDGLLRSENPALYGATLRLFRTLSAARKAAGL